MRLAVALAREAVQRRRRDQLGLALLPGKRLKDLADPPRVVRVAGTEDRPYGLLLPRSKLERLPVIIPGMGKRVEEPDGMLGGIGLSRQRRGCHPTCFPLGHCLTGLKRAATTSASIPSRKRCF